MATERRLAVTPERWVAVQQLASFSRRQWKVAGWTYLAALLIMGVAGETLPGASAGRVVPIQWWNYVTLVLSPPLIALIAATFAPPGQPRKGRRLAKTGTGVGGAAGTIAMACPVCNPLAIPIFGAAGVLSFLAPYRGLIALLSIVLLAVTLLIRLRTTRTCQLPPQAGPSSGSSRDDSVSCRTPARRAYLAALAIIAAATGTGDTAGHRAAEDSACVLVKPAAARERRSAWRQRWR